jgi:hypothetical protein
VQNEWDVRVETMVELPVETDKLAPGCENREARRGSCESETSLKNEPDITHVIAWSSNKSRRVG